MHAVNKWATACVLAGAVAFAIPATGQSGTTGSQTGTTGGQTGSGGTMGEPTGTGADQTMPRPSGREDASIFIKKAAISNLAEIQLGQLAQQQAQDPEVKQFAQMMIDHHTKAQSQLEQIASSSGMTLPTSIDAKHQRIQTKLERLNGAAFDREYMKVMVDAHQDAEKLLKRRMGRADDPFAASGGTGSAGTGAGASGTSGTSGTAGTSGTSGTSTSGTSGTSGTAAAGDTSTVASSLDSYASTALPEVQQHLQQAKDLAKRVKDSGKTDRDK